MPELSNIRHERFAVLYVKTGSASASYLKAGYAPTTRSGLDAAASRLARNGKTQRRIVELRGQLAKRSAVTLDTLLDDLTADRALALHLGQPSAAIAATMSKAKLLGLLVDRREHGAPGEFAAVLSEAEIVSRVRAELGEEAAQQLANALAQADGQTAVEQPHAVADRPGV